MADEMFGSNGDYLSAFVKDFNRFQSDRLEVIHVVSKTRQNEEFLSEFFNGSSDELRNIRSISRKVDSLGVLVYATGGKSLVKNHWPASTVAAIGIACHGIASFLIMFTSLFQGAKLCARICNADDNEVSFAYYKGRCKILNMKSMTRGVSILSSSRIQKLSALIQTHFRRHDATNGKRDRFNVVNYSRNTNSTLIDVDMYGTEDIDVTNENDIDNLSNENVETLSLKIKNRSKARRLS
jgi:hypothetical protein